VAGMATAIASIAAGHPVEMTLLAYMTAGMIGSLAFIGLATRLEPEMRR
jgi:hypothetical protein